MKVSGFLHSPRAKREAEFSGNSRIEDFSADSDGRVARRLHGEYTVDELKALLADLERVQNAYNEVAYVCWLLGA